MNTSVLKREQEIDFAKGITILSVVIGHLVTFNRPLFDCIFAFHMPFFFILQGYMQKSSLPPFGRFLRARVKRLLIPSWIYRVLAFVFLWNLLLEQRWPSVRETFITVVWGYGVDWFVPVAFMVSLCMYGFALLRHRFSDELLFGTVSVSAAAVMILCAHLYPFHDTIYIPFKLDSLALAFAFAILGYWLRRLNTIGRFEALYDGLNSKARKLAFLLFLLGVYAFLAVGNAYSYSTNIASNQVGRSSVVFYFTATLMFCVLLIGGRKVNACQAFPVRWLRLCGRHSLLIYFLHGVLFQLIKLAVYRISGGSLDLIPMGNLNFFWVSTFFALTMLPLTILCIAMEKRKTA